MVKENITAFAVSDILSFDSVKLAGTISQNKGTPKQYLSYYHLDDTSKYIQLIHHIWILNIVVHSTKIHQESYYCHM